jgi:hypothetical protein
MLLLEVAGTQNAKRPRSSISDLQKQSNEDQSVGNHRSEALFQGCSIEKANLDQYRKAPKANLNHVRSPIANEICDDVSKGGRNSVGGGLKF